MIIQIPEWGPKSDWVEANHAIDHLVSIHKTELSRAATTAREMQVHLESIFPLQDDLCSLTCRHCPSPCCLNATVWIDFRDLVFLHLSGQVIPRLQLIERQTDICRYSTPGGCSLPRLSRPFICTLYLCPPQMSNLRRMNKDIGENYHMRINKIKSIRKRLENQFMDVVG